MTTNLSWDALFFKGSVVDLDAVIWSARVGLTPQDLGIENTEDVRLALSLGCHRLLPREAFRNIGDIAREAKRYVDDHSLNFPFIRGARYIPETKVEALLEKLRLSKGLFDGAVDAFVAGYKTAKREFLPVVQKALCDAARGREAAEKAFDRLLDYYPAEEEVRGLFSLTWKIYAISGTKSKSATEAITAETESVKEIVREMVSQLRADFTAKVQIISNSVSRGGKLKGNTISSTRETLERIESLNIFGDAELSRQIRALRVVLDKASVVDDTKTLGIDADLDRIGKSLNTSIEEAIANAENTLTAVGRRQIQIPKEVE